MPWYATTRGSWPHWSGSTSSLSLRSASPPPERGASLPRDKLELGNTWNSFTSLVHSSWWRSRTRHFSPPRTAQALCSICNYASSTGAPPRFPPYVHRTTAPLPTYPTWGDTTEGATLLSAPPKPTSPITPSRPDTPSAPTLPEAPADPRLSSDAGLIPGTEPTGIWADVMFRTCVSNTRAGESSVVVRSRPEGDEVWCIMYTEDVGSGPEVRVVDFGTQADGTRSVGVVVFGTRHEDGKRDITCYWEDLAPTDTRSLGVYTADVRARLLRPPPPTSTTRTETTAPSTTPARGGRPIPLPNATTLTAPSTTAPTQPSEPGPPAPRWATSSAAPGSRTAPSTSSLASSVPLTVSSAPPTGAPTDSSAPYPDTRSGSPHYPPRQPPHTFAPSTSSYPPYPSWPPPTRPRHPRASSNGRRGSSSVLPSLPSDFLSGRRESKHVDFSPTRTYREGDGAASSGRPRPVAHAAASGAPLKSAMKHRTQKESLAASHPNSGMYPFQKF
ncbi:hypothetical protein Q5752_001654 [Cryptotrichosporon argae]